MAQQVFVDLYLGPLLIQLLAQLRVILRDRIALVLSAIVCPLGGRAVRLQPSALSLRRREQDHPLRFGPPDDALICILVSPVIFLDWLSAEVQENRRVFAGRFERVLEDSAVHVDQPD